MKTSDLVGTRLDWAVARALGIPVEELKVEPWGGIFRYLRDIEGKLDGRYMTGPDLLFSTKWEAGGPIIERERIDLQAKINAGSDYDEWLATFGVGAKQRRRYGPTPLIAAMRCFVAAKLGDEVDVPF